MDNEPIGYKLLISYDVKPEVINEYRQFVMGRYIPFLGSMGMQISQAWHTAYGDAPNRLLEFICREKKTVSSLLDNDNWNRFNDELETFVIDLNYKVVPYKDGFQL